MCATQITGVTPSTGTSNSFTVQIDPGGECHIELGIFAGTTFGDAVMQYTARTWIMGPGGVSASIRPSEANEAQNYMEFRVELNAPPSQTVTLDYTTEDGTATAGSDYTATSGTLTIEPSQITHGLPQATIRVPLLEDNNIEESETFTLVLSNPSPSSVLALRNTRGKGTIRDNEQTAYFIQPGRRDADEAFLIDLVFRFSPDPFNIQRLTNALRLSAGRITHLRRDLSHSTVEIVIQPPDSRHIEIVLPRGTVIGQYTMQAETRHWLIGPLDVTIDDAQATEAPDATIEFAVRLDPASPREVAVDYKTIDGTATAGDDYTATSGTLTFNPGETLKYISVPILDDDIDEDDEQFTVKIEAYRDGATSSNSTATGTITNSDPMPRAWAVRFGRTVAEQVLSAIESRMETPSAPGMTVNLSGNQNHLQQIFQAEAANHLHRFPPPEKLLQSSFSLTSEKAQNDRYTFWGQGAVSNFKGQEDGRPLDGQVTTALIGADWSRHRLTAGLIVGHSLGDGSYQGQSAESNIKAILTGIYPWGRYALSKRVSLWGATGYGAGTLTLARSGSSILRTDLDLTIGAVGLRGELLQAPDTGGLQLALKTDAMTLRTTTARTTNLAASDGRVTRVRLGLEGSWPLRFGANSMLTPSLEIGLRHDAGDAETGYGTDLGFGLAWSDPRIGLSAELRARGLLSHEAHGFRDNGFSAALLFDPAPESNRGLNVALTQTVGAAATGGIDQLFRQDALTDLVTDEGRLASQRLEMRLGYGMAMFGGSLTGTPEAAIALLDTAREYSLGWRLGFNSQTAARRLELRLEASRREGTDTKQRTTPPVHAVGIRLMSGW